VHGKLLDGQQKHRAMMERQYIFKVYYCGDFLCETIAHTKWEAMDRAFSEYVGSIDNLTRGKIIAKKLG
jgi:hypothetical protein